MIRRALLHITCALLLIVAQYGALTHAIWHLHHSPTPVQGLQTYAGTGSDQEGGSHSPQSRLCDLHFALGAVLGGDCGAQASTPQADASHALVAVFASGHAVRSDLTHRSRAPPVLL